MEDVKVVVCRLCLNIITYDECQTLDSVSKDILKGILPKVDLDISEDPKICQTCYKTMLRCYRFKCNYKNAKDDKTEIKKNSDTSDTEMISICEEELEKKCNVCFCNRDDESLTEYNARKTFFNEVLQKCLQDWNVSSGTKNVPCKNCLETLTSWYTFVGNCSDTEDKLKNYFSSQGTNSKGKVNLYEAVQFILSKESKESINEFEVPIDSIKTEAIEIKGDVSEEDGNEHVTNSGSEVAESNELEQQLEYDSTTAADEPPPKKKARGHFSMMDKATVLNLFKSNMQKHPKLNKTKTVELTASMAGIGVASVYNILKELDKRGKFVPIRKPYKRKLLLDDVSDEERNQVRSLVHSFFMQKEIPTVDKMLSIISADERFLHLSNITMRRLLNEINFRFKGAMRSKILKEKDEIVIWRRQYLTQIKRFREEHRPIYYIDETCMEGTNQSKSFNVLHIGSEKGFVKDGLLFFKPNNSDECDDKFKTTLFEKWFDRILPGLEENAVIVLNNTPYTTRLLEKIPTTMTPKTEIQEWLASKGVHFEQDMVRMELLALVKKTKPPTNNYVIDEMARKDNRSVLRLPPYHSELNPLKLIWTLVKGKMLKSDETCKVKEVRSVFFDVLASINLDDWQKAIRHALKIENEMWQLDIDMEMMLEQLITNCSSTESETDSE